MGKFFYIARDASGKKLSGVEEGSTAEEIVSRLQAKELIVVTVASEQSDAKGLRQEIAAATKQKFRRNAVKQQDLVMFCRQLATLLGAGVTIIKSLEIISMQVASFRFFNVVKGLQKNMEGGLSLHESMAKYPAVFSELWVNLAESGEASGNLAVILARLATYLERSAEFKRKVVSALIYPSMLFCAGLGALLFLTMKIIPTFGEIFKGAGAKLPWLTQMLLLTSELLRKYFLLIIAVGITAVILFKKFIKTKNGRQQFEMFKLNLPIFGEFFHALCVERFSSEMSTLVESGVPILYALEITEHSVGNVIMADIIRKVKEDVREGRTLSQPLQKSGFFEPMVVQMISIGEEIGELSPMFKKINLFYQEYVETFLARFATIFEPFILVFMGGVIAIMIVGMFLPIFQLSQTMK